jgi:hypothetical protein
VQCRECLFYPAYSSYAYAALRAAARTSTIDLSWCPVLSRLMHYCYSASCCSAFASCCIVVIMAAIAGFLISRHRCRKEHRQLCVEAQIKPLPQQQQQAAGGHIADGEHQPPAPSHHHQQQQQGLATRSSCVSPGRGDNAVGGSGGWGSGPAAERLANICRWGSLYACGPRKPVFSMMELRVLVAGGIC